MTGAAPAAHEFSQPTDNKTGTVKQPVNVRKETWSFFDKIYCISIDDRKDRRQQAREQFAAVGLLERVEFVIVVRHPDNREQGIFESHLNCLKRGLSTGARNILIFEDDVFFQNLDHRALAEALSALEKTANWNGLFLGAITEGSRKTGCSSLAAVKYRCLSHAYALNRSFAELIVRQQWTGLPYDGLLRSQCTDFYALYPMCAFQGDLSSDNQTPAIDRLRRLCGGLRFIQKANEFYQNRKPQLIAAHLLLASLLAVLLLRLW
jgi:hypothetical protein